MRTYLWVFLGTMLVVNIGCAKPVQFTIIIDSLCEGNILQADVHYTYSYFAAAPDFNSSKGFQWVSFVKKTEGSADLYITTRLVIEDGADLDEDGILDSGDLNGTPPDTDVLVITLDYLDTDDTPNDIWVASAGTIREGTTISILIDYQCVAHYYIDNPASIVNSGSETQATEGKGG